MEGKHRHPAAEKIDEVERVEHHPAMPYKDIGDFMAKLRAMPAPRHAHLNSAS